MAKILKLEFPYVVHEVKYPGMGGDKYTRCKTLADAIDYLKSCPPENDPVILELNEDESVKRILEIKK